MYIEPSLRGLLTVFFRQQKKFCIVFGLILSLGMIYVSGIDRTYEARGSFLIKLGHDAVPDISRTGAQGGGEMMAAEHSEIMHSNIRILESDDLLDAAVKEVGAERLYPGISKTLSGGATPERAAVERLQTHDLKTATDSQSSLVEVFVRNQDPDTAREFATRLIDKFIVRQSQVYNAPQTEFLQQQVADAQKTLQDSQRAFQDFKQKAGIFDLEGETTQLLAEKTSLSGSAFQAVTAAQATLSKLESDAALSLSTYRPDSPIIKRLNDSIAIAREEVRKRQGDLNAVGGDDSALSPKLAKIDERLALLESERGEYSELEQRVHEDEENYKFYRQRGEEARSAALLSSHGITRISIVDKPSVPMRSMPRKRALLVIAFLMTGALFGLGTVAAFELTADSLAYPEQVLPATGLPILASFGGGKP
jgi:uncharacterized protein involved in exopolysaccharide biosynthesis